MLNRGKKLLEETFQHGIEKRYWGRLQLCAKYLQPPILSRKAEGPGLVQSGEKKKTLGTPNCGLPVLKGSLSR